MSPFSLNRRAFVGLFCGTAAALGSTAGAAASAPLLLRAPPTPRLDAVPLTVAVGMRTAFMFRHLPLNIAQQLDFFAAEGVDVTVQGYASDALALQAMHAGVADACAVDFEQSLRAPAAQGAAAQCFVVQGRSPQAALGVSLRALPQFKALGDLRRRKVGVCELGSLSHITAQLALLEAGVAPGDVAFVPVGQGAGAVAALRAGRVHALCHGDPVMARLEQRGDVRIACEARTLQGARALFGGDLPGGCLVAPTAFLQKRTAQAQALANGIVHALKWLQSASPADLAKTLPASDLGNERNLYLSAFARARETISPDGAMPSDGPLTALRTLSRTAPGLVAAGLEPGRTFTSDFARKAKLKFGA